MCAYYFCKCMMMYLIILIITINFALLAAQESQQEDYEVNHRVIGGSKVSISNAIFMGAVIRFHEEYTGLLCGTAIIAKKWTITAACCFDDIDESSFNKKTVLVRTNTSDWVESPGKIDHKILAVVKHNLYDESGFHDYDIALVKVEKPFDGYYEEIIDLASEITRYQDFSIATIYGWGKTSRKSKILQRNLYRANITLYPWHSCKHDLRERSGIDFKLTWRHFCSDIGPGKSTICGGDKGGPVVQFNKLIGIMSWNQNCDPDVHTVYTRLGRFHSWIHYQMRNSKENGVNPRQPESESSDSSFRGSYEDRYNYPSENRSPTDQYSDDRFAGDGSYADRDDYRSGEQSPNYPYPVDFLPDDRLPGDLLPEYIPDNSKYGIPYGLSD